MSQDDRENRTSGADPSAAPSPGPAAPPPVRAPRAAALVTIGILASRLVGLVRQRVIAHFLGTSDTADAVAAAFRIGNITQNLLGEAALSASFIPVYVRLRLRSQDLAARFARALLGILLTVVVIASALGAAFAPALTVVVAGGFEGDKLALTAGLVRILFPMTGVLVLGAWALGVLTSHRRFLLPYLAPVVWSAAQIVAIFVAALGAGLRGPDLARALAWGAVAGAVLQLGMMLIPVRSILGSVVPTFDRHAEGVSESIARFPGSLAARGVIQISGLVDTFLVSFLGAGANATFQYAQTLYLLPMSLLGTGEAAAALPELAEQDLDTAEARERVLASMSRSLTRVFVLALAAAGVFIAFGVEVTTLLFRGGSFGAASAAGVGAALAAYAFGLPANAASRILGAATFARGDTRRPALYATLRVCVSTVISIVLMGPFGVPGVIFGAVLAAWLELVLLARNVHRTYGGTGLGGVPLLKVLIVAIAPVASGLPLKLGLAEMRAGPFLSAAAVLGAAAVTFVVAARVTRLFDLRSLLRGR